MTKPYHLNIFIRLVPYNSCIDLTQPPVAVVYYNILIRFEIKHVYTYPDLFYRPCFLRFPYRYHGVEGDEQLDWPNSKTWMECCQFSVTRFV